MGKPLTAYHHVVSYSGRLFIKSMKPLLIPFIS